MTSMSRNHEITGTGCSVISPPLSNLNAHQRGPCNPRVKHAHIGVGERALTWQMHGYTWNVRTLLDTEGLVEATRQGRVPEAAEDLRIDQVVWELNRYQILVGALQETKWFRRAVYHVGGSIHLHQKVQ